VAEHKSLSKTELVDRVKAILQGKGLTLYKCSQMTRKLYGRSSPYFVPHNLYYDLENGTFSPSLHQLFALSKVSGYNFNDWLRGFGFNPEDIARLQVLLSSQRTSMLDSSLVDPEVWIPWLRNKPGNVRTPAIAPLGRLLEMAPSRRLRSIDRSYKSNFVHAKIGREDALAFPDLLPGSIVRADTRITQVPTSNGRTDSKALFLIQHSNGFYCCRLQTVAKNRVIPLCGHLPYAQVELQLHEEARVLGILDLEIRPLLKPEQPDVPAELAAHWRPTTLGQDETRLGHLLRAARLRMGLSFREASAMSLQVSAELGDEQYFAAPGSLSDYEARDVPPRHVHKAITLCAIYGLHFATLLKSIGLHLEDAGRDAIPDRLLPGKIAAGSRGFANETDDPIENGFLGHLLRRSGHVPFFLRESLSDLSGLNNLSLHDFFWVGGESNPLHPLLVNGLLAIVNRHRKKPIYFRSKPLWQQPVYVLLRRNGTYTCGCCGLENRTLVIHPYSPTYQPPEQLRNHDDAEIIGQVVTVARRL
jgi:transcriptional regulator with XRE-family HTH domain